MLGFCSEDVGFVLQILEFAAFTPVRCACDDGFGGIACGGGGCADARACETAMASNNGFCELIVASLLCALCLRAGVAVADDAVRAQGGPLLIFRCSATHSQLQASFLRAAGGCAGARAA